MLFKKTKDNSITALIDSDGRKITYGELNEQTDTLSKILKKRAVILVLCDISLETVSIYYSLLNLGIVPIMMDPKSSNEQIIKAIREYKPYYFWCRIEAYKNMRENIGKLLLPFNDYGLYKTPYRCYEIYSELALLLNTSGSTGSSKMVRISYNNILYNTNLLMKFLNVSASDIGITSLPIHHCLGLALLHLCWEAGARVCLFGGTVLEPNYKRMIDENNVSITFLVPYSLKLLMMTNYHDAKFDSFRQVLVGGGRLEDEFRDFLVSFCEIHGMESFVGYGQTEGTCFISGINTRKIVFSEDVGYVSGGLVGTIKHPDADGVGELVISGKSVSLGYAQGCKDLVREDDNKGLLHTGDLAYITSNGEVFLKGRLKRIVKILGERISLDDVENYLKERFSEIEIVCVDKEDTICVFHDGGRIFDNEIKECISSGMKIYKAMIKAIAVESIPRLANGKINYQKLGKMINN